MKTTDEILRDWAMPELTDKVQTTLRMPAMTAAKVRALEKVYPKKPRNDILCDLLELGVQQLESALPRKRINMSAEEVFDLTGENSGSSWREEGVGADYDKYVIDELDRIRRPEFYAELDARYPKTKQDSDQGDQPSSDDK